MQEVTRRLKISSNDDDDGPPSLRVSQEVTRRLKISREQIQRASQPPVKVAGGDGTPRDLETHRNAATTRGNGAAQEVTRHLERSRPCAARTFTLFSLRG